VAATATRSPLSLLVISMVLVGKRHRRRDCRAARTPCCPCEHGLCRGPTGRSHRYRPLVSTMGGKSRAGAGSDAARLADTGGHARRLCSARAGRWPGFLRSTKRSTGSHRLCDGLDRDRGCAWPSRSYRGLPGKNGRQAMQVGPIVAHDHRQSVAGPRTRESMACVT
jgi:hypothetical protein